MKTKLILTAACALMLTPVVKAEDAVRETTTTVQPTEAIGTITDFEPDAIVVRTKEATAPIRYSFTKTTEYLDEDGNRIKREVVKTGMPVTIRYVKEGDRMVVNRIIVRKQTTTTAPDAVTTTTTSTVQPTESAGTITELNPEAIVVRTQDATEPVRYTFTKTTEYVDEDGNRVARNIVKTGVPVTVRYVREGDRLVVNRVIVRKQSATTEPEAVTTKKTTTTTTTTRDKEKD